LGPQRLAARWRGRHPRHEPALAHPGPPVARLHSAGEPRHGCARAQAPDWNPDMDSLIFRRVAVVAMTLLVSGVAASAADAQGRPPVTRLVTYAARVCDSYTDITANRARNDIQESLEDLGPDTLYGAGEAVSAEKEAAGQPACRPLPDWR